MSHDVYIFVLQSMEVDEQLSVEPDRREATEQEDEDVDTYERVCLSVCM